MTFPGMGDTPDLIEKDCANSAEVNRIVSSFRKNKEETGLPKEFCRYQLG